MGQKVYLIISYSKDNLPTISVYGSKMLALGNLKELFKEDKKFCKDNKDFRIINGLAFEGMPHYEVFYKDKEFVSTYIVEKEINFGF